MKMDEKEIAAELAEKYGIDGHKEKDTEMKERSKNDRKRVYKAENKRAETI